MSRDEVESLLGVGKYQRRGYEEHQSEDLELTLQIERGVRNPMEYFETIPELSSGLADKGNIGQQEKVTIVLDPKKGIYKLDDSNTNIINTKRQ